MTLDQLRVFLMVARHEHVTRAAEHLHMTQSAVSAALAALETRHNLRLFHRVGRGITLTEAGRSFIPYAEELLLKASEAERLLGELGQTIGGQLRLAASQTVISYWLPAPLVQYRQAYPQVELTLAAGNTRLVAQWVHEGRVDLGVIEGEVEDPDLTLVPLVRDEMVVLVGHNHPWSTTPPAPQDLAGSAWVLRESGSGTRALFDRALRAMGQAPKDLPVLLELPSNEACIAALGTGDVATALSRRAAAPHLAQGLVTALPLALEARDFTLIHHRTRHLSRAAQAMIDRLRGSPFPPRSQTASAE